MPGKVHVDRVHTGITEFDRLISGGFRKNSINLIAGGAGSGKTIFAIQYLLNGIEKYNEPGMYITFEERKERLYDDMLELGWDIAQLEEQQKFVFLHYKPEQVKKLLTEGGGIIETLITENNIKRLVIDSISSFTLLYKDELSKKQAALSLFELLSKWGITSLLTSEDESPEGGTITAALEFEVDGVIFMYHERKKGTRIRAMEILKMRGTRHSESTMLMKITSKGIRISPEEVVVF
jgi:circadian clock protein KaiC